MPTSILATKLYIPPPRPHVVLRPRLIERLNEGLHRKLTLISAPAGFGKTTLISAWAAEGERPVAWLSLDEGDNDPARFLMYLIAAVRTVAGQVGEGALRSLQAPQPPPMDTILTALLNELATIPHDFALVLDDYHMIEAKSSDQALTFLLEHLPPQMHLVIATREDPYLPLARLRARNQLAELRVTDLRFTLAEAVGFLNEGMGLDLSTENIAALETRTEGWIAGLQLAAISMQGYQDTADFIRTFTGSHRFVMDYLVEEVLQQQPESIQTFLLNTSILDRLCGSLCEAVLLSAAVSGQETLEYLERANLFIVPLDNERRWYRYHHLFADLLRQRLLQSYGDEQVAEFHQRASQWYEEHGLELEAFHHAAAAQDFGRAERLIEGNGMPLHFRGAQRPILNWLETLPKNVLDAWPALWTVYASVLLVTGQATRVEQTLQAAEIALQGMPSDDKTRDLIGRIAAIRATAATTRNQAEIIIAHSNRALEYLHPRNLAFRTSTIWKLGYAYMLQGERAAAYQAYAEVVTIGQATGNIVFTLLANIGLGFLREQDTQLSLAAATYQKVLDMLGEHPLPFASEAHLGLARISYERNDLAAAYQHGQQALQLARQIENNDRFVACEVLLARLKLAQGDVAGAASVLAQAEHLARQHHFVQQQRDIAPIQVLILLRQGNVVAAAEVAADLPISQVRVLLAQGETTAALAILDQQRQQAEAHGWADARLKVLVLQVLALHAQGDSEQAWQVLDEVLALAEAGGFIRLLVDEGLPMGQLLSKVTPRSDYLSQLLAIFEEMEQQPQTEASLTSMPFLIEPLSQREVEILRLIARGLSNQEISEQLFLALSTVKGHNQNIFGKLQVQRRTEAVARARELGLL